MNKIITISREYGSGGKEIGEKLAKQLVIPFFDKELITIASKQSGVSPDLLERYDEIQSSSLLYSLVMGTYPVSDGARLYPDMPLYHQVFTAQFDAIRSIAADGPCVIVGRCSDYVLKDRKNVVNVFITADLSFKIERLTKINGVSEKKAKETIEKIDKKRANYYKYYTERKWGLASNYDLSINSSRIGIENTVKLIMEYVELR